MAARAPVRGVPLKVDYLNKLVETKLELLREEFQELLSYKLSRASFEEFSAKLDSRLDEFIDRVNSKFNKLSKELQEADNIRSYKLDNLGTALRNNLLALLNQSANDREEIAASWRVSTEKALADALAEMRESLQHQASNIKQQQEEFEARFTQNVIQVVNQLRKELLQVFEDNYRKLERKIAEIDTRLKTVEGGKR